MNLPRLAHLLVLGSIGLFSFASIARAQSPSLDRKIGATLFLKFKPAAVAIHENPSLEKALRDLSEASEDLLLPLFRETSRTDNALFERYGLSRIFALRLKSGIPPDSAEGVLSRFAELEYVDRDHLTRVEGLPQEEILPRVPNDSLYADQWALPNTRVPDAWQLTSGDTSVVIAFVDTGVDWLHPDLRGQFRINHPEDINGNGMLDPWAADVRRRDAFGNEVGGDLDGIDQDGNGYADDVMGYNFVDQKYLNLGDFSERDPIPFDEHDHGTLVAGVLGARANNRIGVAGVAPGCRLLPIRSFDATGNADDDDVASGILYAADNGARIINLSFGDIVPSLVQRDAIRYATSRGALVVASSGNRGTDERHFPSEFDEVLSAGATQNFPNADVPWNQGSFGQGMDIVAPGAQIATTRPGNDYSLVSGTSFSAPMVAAVAALLASYRPTLSVEEIRSTLISTTKDISSPGYDHFSANGRVDALAALRFEGGARIKIISPHSAEGFVPGARVRIVGSAASALFKSYTLSFAPGLNPDATVGFNAWKEILRSEKQVIAGVLGEWNTAGVTTGTYTLRLAVETRDGRSVEERMTIYLHSEAPTVEALAVDPIFINEKRGLLVRLSSDQFGYCEVLVSSGADSVVKNDGRFARTHAVFFAPEDLVVGGLLKVHVRLRNAQGLWREEVRQVDVPNESIPQRGFDQKQYALPAGYALDSVLTTPQGDVVTMNVFRGGLSFGNLANYRFADGRFSRSDSLTESWIPRAIGNTKGTGGAELLLQAGNSAKILKQNQEHLLFGDSIYHSGAASLSGSILADLTKDGRDELVVKRAAPTRNGTEEYFQIMAWNGARYDSIGRLYNNTAPAPGYRDNLFVEPATSAAKLLNDTLAIVTIDNDADVLAYQRDELAPGGFRLILSDENIGQAEGSLLTAGDFDGDGRDDIAFAYHNQFEPNELNEYDPVFWTVKVLFNGGDGTFRTGYLERFYFARPLNPYRSSVQAIPSVTGGKGRDLVLSFFPNFYLLRYDALTRTMKPVWHYPVSASPRGALAWDFDRNGVAEFGFVAGDSIRFFEREAAFATRTPAPSALRVYPRDTNRVDLYWAAVEGATKYYVLRAEDVDGSQYVVIDSTAAPHYTDSDVENGNRFIYSVGAFSEDFDEPFSLPAFGVTVEVHPTPFVAAVKPRDSLSLLVTMSRRTSSSEMNGGWFVIDDDARAGTAALQNDSSVLITLGRPIAIGEHTLRIASFGLLDDLGAPFDTSRRYTFELTPVPATPESFYILQWRFLNGRIHVVFSREPSSEALDPAFFTLDPFGKVTRVTRDDANAQALYLDVEGVQDLRSIGRPYLLCIGNIHDVIGTPLEQTTGRCAGLLEVAQDLASMFVYPNPARPNDLTLTFAGLTAQASIAIYSISMKLIARLETRDRAGAVEWNMMDEKGRPLPSGIYIYYATGKDSAGNAVEAASGKFVIVRE